MKVAFIDTVHEVLWNGLLELGYDCVDFSTTDDSIVVDQIGNYEGLVVRSRFPIDSNFLKKAKVLKFIARSGAGMENIDVAYCNAHGIQLFSAPEGNRNAVAEHALGMLLSLFNKLHTADQEVRNGKWDREGNRGVELDGKTVGIIGYGNNGSAFAKKLSGFDCSVLTYDKYKKNYGDSYAQETSLADLLKRSDVVSLHIPQNEETLWYVDAQFINQVARPFYLINLSRGKLVRITDLLGAIKEGKILGACLDVLEYEKSSFEDMFNEESMEPSFKLLLENDKVILSPHVGGWTHESYYKLSLVLLNKIKKQFNS